MRHATFCLFLSLLAAGCAGHRPAFESRLPGPGTTVEVILRDLDAQDRALKSFEARKVTLVLRGAGLDAKQQLSGSTLYYEKPGKLRLKGQKLGHAYRLTVKDRVFLLEMPGENTYYHRTGGISQAAGASNVSPGDAVEELLSPEPWGALDARDVALETPAGTPDMAVLRFAASRDQGMTRELTVREVEGKWVPVQNDLSQDGRILMHATYDDYVPQGGILFPMKLEIHFPGEDDAFLRFSIGAVVLNPALDPQLFDVTAQLEELRSKGYVEREPQH